MAFRHTSSTGLITVTTKIETPILVSPSDASVSKQLEIHRIEIGNASGADAAVGWGFRWPSTGFIIGDYNTGTGIFTDRTADLAAGAVALGTGGGIMLQIPDKFNGFSANVTVTGGAVSARKIYNGSAFVASNGSQKESFAPLSLGTSSELALLDPLMSPFAAGDTAVANGASVGYFGLLIELAAPVTLDAVYPLSLINYVGVIADGNSLIDSYDGGKELPGGAQVVPYISTANADNFSQVEYSLS